MNEKTAAEPECVIFVKEVTPEQKAILDKILIELIKEDRFYEPPSIMAFWCD